MSDAGSDRGGRRPFEQGDGKTRDFSNWERKGPLSPAAAAAPSLREGGRQQSKDGPAFRKASPAWGEGTNRSQDGSRPPRREYQEKPAVERAPMASELDSQWRTKMRPDAPAKSPTPSQEPSDPPSPLPATLPVSRPKLNLQKRTVSEADPNSSPVASASASEAKASPFGAARPVDTSAKEKEIEEKRQLAVRQKKEAEEKAKAEKAEEKRLAKEAKDNATLESETKEKSPNAEKENVTEVASSAKNFEILRRTSEGTDGMTTDNKEVEGDSTVLPTDDKAVKPRQVIRDPPQSSKASEGGWRGQKTQESAPSTEDTTKVLEEDGWSTVSNTKQRSNRRPNQAARAIAS
jgi:translation initiation factor 4B